MPCGCANDRCSCTIVPGPNVTVTGSGTPENPYVVSADTSVVDIGGGTGDGSDPRFIGEVITYSGPTPPSADYLPADGRELSRTVYPTLFARLGTFYGAGNGTTTFNIPNLGGKVSLGADDTHTRGSSGGAETKVLTTGNLPAHTHGMNHDHPDTGSAGDHDHQLTRSDGTGIQAANIPRGTGVTVQTNRGGIDNDGAHTHDVPAYVGSTGSVGTGDPLNVMPPYVAIPKYIRVQGGP